MVILLLNLLLTISFTSEPGTTIPDSFKTRIEKELKPFFKADEYTYEFIAQEEHSSLFTLSADSEFAGYLALTSSKGRFERFEYMVLYSKDVVVKKVKVLQYNSSRGTEITAKRWLRQFEGCKGETLKYGKDIQAISGATYSATSITEDIPLVTQWVKKVINSKK